MKRTSITIGAFALVAGCQDAMTPTPRVSSVVAAAQASEAEYTAVELPTLPGGSLAIGEAINARGQVVGMSNSGASVYWRATRWTNDEPADLGTLGGTSSYAYDINARGDVVGYSSVSSTSGYSHAFRFSDRRGMEDLGTLGGPNSSASAISDNGTVVGYAELESSSGPRHAFRWTPTSGMEDLGTLPGWTNSYALDISNAGEIVGNVDRQGQQGFRAVLWTTSGEIVDLGTLPGGTWSGAEAVNERGEIVGMSWDPSGTVHAVLWTASREIVDLGVLPGDVAGSVAYAVNGAGTIVGESRRLNPSIQIRGFVSVRQEGMRELPGLPGATYTVVSAINEAGTAAGSSGPYYTSTRAVKWVRSQSPAAGRAP